MGMHQWGFAEGAQVYLPFRQSVPTDASTGSTLSATFAAATNRLGPTDGSGRFANYIFKPGDLIEIFDDADTAGTGVAIPGRYEVTGKVDDDTITLSDNVLLSGNSTGTVEFSIDLSWAALPDDFGAPLKVQMQENLSSHFEWTSLGHIADLRANSEGDSRLYRGALNYAVNTMTDGQPTPRIELYPSPRTNNNKAMRMFYRHGWSELDSDNTTLRLPDWMEPLYLEVYRCFLLGTEEHDIGTVNLRLAEVKAGPVYMAAKAEDGRRKSLMGGMRNTHVPRRAHPFGYTRRSINSPD